MGLNTSFLILVLRVFVSEIPFIVFFTLLLNKAKLVVYILPVKALEDTAPKVFIGLNTSFLILVLRLFVSLNDLKVFLILVVSNAIESKI